MLTFIEIEGRFYVEQLGALGLHPFGLPEECTGETLWEHLKQVYPYSLQSLYVVAGLEGPQTVLSWTPPAKPIARMMIRRKLREFPIDPGDGILVLDDPQTANSRTTISDCAANNLIRMLSEYLNIDETAVTLSKSIFSIFDTDDNGVVEDTVVADFYEKYEARYQVSLDPYYKTTKVRLIDVALEAQKRDLLQAPQTSDSNWWYYRIFVQPELVEVGDQFAGAGAQVLADIEFENNTQYLGSTFIDIQTCPNLTVVVENGSNQPLNFVLYTVPELPGGQDRLTDAAHIQNDYEIEEARRNVPAGESVLISLSDLSLKYISALGLVENLDAEGDLDEGEIKVHFIVNKLIHWQSNSYLSRPCLVYKTGRHKELIWDRGHLPSVYTGLDEHPDGPPKQALPHENITRLEGQERINLYEQQREQGPLYRFLKLFELELDRNTHYLRAMVEFNANIYEAPRELLGHIAYELGWEVDLDRPLIEVRFELMRLAGLYKAKGSTRLYEAMSAQQTRVFPRVQEGPGMVARAANPDVF
jgi:hypothetical protein